MSISVATTRSRRTKPTAMRAAVISAPGAISFIERPLPCLRPRQVLVRMQGCGVCGSNVPVWEGRPWFEYPREPGSPGHEGWGTIAEVGQDVEYLEVGQRVTVLTYHAFADYDVAEVEDVVPLPELLGNVPFPGEPLGCAVNVARRSNLQSGQIVAIVGIGFLGALLTKLAAHAGSEVIAISRRDTALEIAQLCGARHCIRLDDPQSVFQQVQRITKGELCQLSIEAIGSQRGLDIASELIANRGRLVIAGFHQDGPRTVNMQSWNWRGIDVVNAHERDSKTYVTGIKSAIELAASGLIDFQPLLTHSFHFDELEQGFDTCIARPPGFLKAIIRFDE
jgi:threonine dehydrogenase-like Zn-dependent dehydrogenase